MTATSICRYCVGYITKGERTHSDLYRLMLRLRRERGYTDRQLLYRISSEALRSKETSAQEAAWVLLQYPLSEKSRKCQFIDTSLRDNRRRSQKTGKQWKDLDGESTDVWLPDVYDRYSCRPDYLEKVSLAVYAASYLNSNRKQDAEGHDQPRGRDWIVRYRKFDPKRVDGSERENFYRAMCTLHLPWRDEEADIIRAGEESGSFESLYHQQEDIIMHGRRRFEVNIDIEVDLHREKEKCVADDEPEDCELDSLVRRYVTGENKYVFEETERAEYMDDSGQDIRLDVSSSVPAPARTVAAARQRADWDRPTLHRYVRMLNKRQRDAVLTVIDGIRLRSPPR